MSTTLRIQVGVEKWNGTRRTARLTPVDHKVEMPDEAAGVILLIAGVSDAKDLQPGDGEVDFKLGAIEDLPIIPFLDAARPFLSSLTGEGWNAFIRIT